MSKPEITRLLSYDKINFNSACKEDVLKVFNLQNNASKEDIRRQYRKLAVQLHPDKNQDDKENADKAFKILQQAYDRYNYLFEHHQEPTKTSQNKSNAHTNNFKKPTFNFSQFNQQPKDPIEHERDDIYEKLNRENGNDQPGTFCYIIINLALNIGNDIDNAFKQFQFLEKINGNKKSQSSMGRAFKAAKIHHGLKSAVEDPDYRPDLKDIIMKVDITNTSEILSENISCIHKNVFGTYQTARNTKYDPNSEPKNKTESNIQKSPEITAITKIYNALFEGETTRFKKRGSIIDSAKNIEDIRKNARDGTRTKKALELYDKYSKNGKGDLSTNNINLAKDIHDYGKAHSGIFSKTSANEGWKNKTSDSILFQTYVENNRGSRSSRIYNALKLES
ncbi:J domain-containing protein [Facilibium subflavum]|uniref:J domain-containing protein n=1 Tax=Facilibium subflavum TaxID=2219058 RepID=UPI000E659087|nr:J domain-containing protein [Facilibium subflavum]